MWAAATTTLTGYLMVPPNRWVAIGWLVITIVWVETWWLAAGTAERWKQTAGKWEQTAADWETSCHLWWELYEAERRH